MAELPIFVDTSGFFAILSTDDRHHKEAVKFLDTARKKKWSFVTTDYILDENGTLLQAREKPFLISKFFEIIEESRAIKIEFIGEKRFWQSREFF